MGLSLYFFVPLIYHPILDTQIYSKMCGLWFPPLKLWGLISKMLISKVPIILSSPEFRFCFVLVVLADLISSHCDNSFHTGRSGFLHLQSESLSFTSTNPGAFLHLCLMVELSAKVFSMRLLRWLHFELQHTFIPLLCHNTFLHCPFLKTQHYLTALYCKFHMG